MSQPIISLIAWVRSAIEPMIGPISRGMVWVSRSAPTATPVPAVSCT